MMKCMLNSTATELHPAQKSDLWAEETANRLWSFLFLAKIKFINLQQF